MPAVGFATRGISIRTLLNNLQGQRLALPVAVDIALSVARLIRAEHLAGRVVGALDATRVALMENGGISLVAGGQRLAPELKSPSAQPTMASDIYALGTLMLQLFTGNEGGAGDAPTNIEVPEELLSLARSCAHRDPKMRPASVKNVEKALSIHLSEPEMDAALDERVALVKQYAPEVPKHLVPQAPMVIATEDITGHNLVGLRTGGGSGLKIIGALVVLLLIGAAFVWWLQFGKVKAVTPPTPVAPVANTPPPEVVPPPEPPKEEVKAAVGKTVEQPPPPEPQAEPSEPPPPPAVKAAPVRVKKHKKR